MTILALLLKASMLLSAVALASAVLGRGASAALRHWIWTLAVVALLLLPALSIALPRWTAVRFTTGSTSAAAAIPREPHTSGSPSQDAFGSGVAESAAASSTEARTGDGFSWSVMLTALYAAGIVFFLARVVTEHRRVRRLAHHTTAVTARDWQDLLAECAGHIGVRRSVHLLRCQKQAIPISFGTWKCAIVIPATSDSWPEDRRRAVLLHELAHVARRDCLTQLLAAVACSVYWVHPAVWWVAHRLRLDRERACDDRVLSTGTDAHDYAEHLIELAYAAPGIRPPRLAACMARPGELTTRVVAILDDARNRTRPAFRHRIVAAAIASAFVIPVSAASASRQAAQSGPTPRFEVASIRPCEDDLAPYARGGAGTGTLTLRASSFSPGTLMLNCQTVSGLIQMAYVIYANGTRLDDAGIILNTPVDGGPGWIHSDRYTIAAKADGEASEGTMRGPMFRALLEERFKLRIRRERRDVDAYALTIARGGPRLQPFQEGSCVALPVPLRLPLPELPPGQRHCKMPGLVGDDPAAKFLAMVIEANAHIEWEGITLDAFVRSALNEMNTGLGRQVIDRTGLNGRFNIRLDYAQPPVDPVRFPALAAARAAAGEPTAPSIETALQEQLGLKLESAKGEGHRFVIESIGRPSEN